MIVVRVLFKTIQGWLILLALSVITILRAVQ
jgi:hypothetical protein